jgi:hypothetical protein
VPAGIDRVLLGLCDAVAVAVDQFGADRELRTDL